MRGVVIEGGIYYPKTLNARRKFRRVIAVIDDRVIYSSGGDRNYECEARTFKKQTTEKPITETENA